MKFHFFLLLMYLIIIIRSMSPKKKQINKLHDYNDIKDAAQTLLGKLGTFLNHFIYNNVIFIMLF